MKTSWLSVMVLPFSGRISRNPQNEWAILVCIFFAVQFLPQVSVAEPARVTISRTNYHQWKDVIRMSNGQVEVLVVPAVGRVMQFRLAGREEGPFWSNRKLDGQAPDTEWQEWRNFGGDKTWPSPEANWPKNERRSWLPPRAFDSLPVQAVVTEGVVTLVSPVDPFYGIRTQRKISLLPDKPVMRIETTYEKVRGDAKRVGVWVITQVMDPVQVYAPVPANSIFPNGCTNQGRVLPPSLRVENGLLSLGRDPRNAFKVGLDGGALLWIGHEHALLIESPREAGSEYPDYGSSAEIYTNPDALPYVELELLGPLHTMKPGDRIQRTSTYTLLHRSESSPEAEARRIRAIQGQWH